MPYEMNGAIRLYHRDLARFRQAHVVEQQAEPKHRMKSAKTVQMSFQDHNLRQPSEITSLLWYLREALIYKWGGYHMLPKKDIAILAPDIWHVSFVNKEEGKEKFTPVSHAHPDLAKLLV